MMAPLVSRSWGMRAVALVFGRIACMGAENAETQQPAKVIDTSLSLHSHTGMFNVLRLVSFLLMYSHPVAFDRSALSNPNGASDQHAPTVDALLRGRGLTTNQIRLSGSDLEPTQVSDTMATLDKLGLHEEQLAYALRRHPHARLKQLDTSRLRAWCSYKKNAWCPCCCLPKKSLHEEEVPRELAFDLEFAPLRFAAVDGDGCVRADYMVKRDPPFRMKWSKILNCDRPTIEVVHLTKIQALLKRLVAEGTVLISHSPHLADVHMLEIPDLPVVDVEKFNERRTGLRKMARKFLELEMQDNAHCAVEDASVTMQLYQHLKHLKQRATSKSTSKKKVGNAKERKQFRKRQKQIRKERRARWREERDRERKQEKIVQVMS
mmetsp:Transcript_76146/g.132050  ORF Transcript_76146/g.132050 Transcript_76146/m.132050 type:complete len:378 (+) Transcript_76146:88-1221(+)